MGQLPDGFGAALIYPEAHLWFIYCLPICFVIARVTRALPPLLVWALAAAEHVFDMAAEPLLFVYLTHYFVFFCTGHVAAPVLFRLAEGVAKHPALAVLALAAWAIGNSWITHGSEIAFPGLSLMLGIAGGVAVAAVAVLAGRLLFGQGLSWLGSRSIVVYLGFFIPMKFAEAFLVPLGLPADITIVLGMAVGVGVPLWLYALLSRLGVGLWLFERPGWARLKEAPPRGEIAGVS